MRKNIIKRLKNKLVFYDGAMGSVLQNLVSDLSCPELLNIKSPSKIEYVHNLYKKAGVNIIETNTFGANKLKLEHYNLEKKQKQINTAGVKIAKKAAGNKLLVAGSIGPTGALISPEGNLEFDEAVEVFSQQAYYLSKAGVDLILLETFSDIKELKAAILGVREADKNIILQAHMTFDKYARSLTGTTPEVFVAAIDAMEVDIIGFNCSVGAFYLVEFAKRAIKYTDKLFCIMPNAGLPEIENGRTVFKQSPKEFAKQTIKAINSGVSILGGCCGTTDAHIKELITQAKTKKFPSRKKTNIFTLTSRTKLIEYGKNFSPLIIGERLNTAASKKFRESIEKDDYSLVREVAIEQVEAGADALDLHIGIDGIDEKSAIKKAIFAICSSTESSIVIDSTKEEIIETGLRFFEGKALINSVNGKKESYTKILPLAKKYGASVIALCLDEKGIPKTAKERIDIGLRILNYAKKIGMDEKNIVFDPLVLSAGSSLWSFNETLKAIKIIRQKLKLPVLLGSSNISYGLPNRSMVNSVFLNYAIREGASLLIVNPNDKTVYTSIITACYLNNLEPKKNIFLKLKELGNFQPAKKKSQKSPKTSDIEDELFKSVLYSDDKNALKFLQDKLKKHKPIDVINKIIVPALVEVGNKYDKGEFYLPHLLSSGNTAKKLFDYIEKFFPGAKGKKIGKIILATVEGDVHDIGKNIVKTLLENNGFEIIDLGKDIKSKIIIDQAVKHKPDLIGLSALMTTTMIKMKEVKELLKEKKIDIPIIIGGAVVTKGYADKIGCYYAADAVSAIKECKKLLNKK